MVSSLRQLTPEVMKKEALKSIKANEDYLTGLNTDQLFAGKLADGSDLPLYSETSVQVFGKRPGPWQLFETGSFYRGFFIRVDKFPIVFASRDNKTGLIAEALAAKGKNPDEVYGLNKSNFTDMAKEVVLPALQERIRKAIRIR